MSRTDSSYGDREQQLNAIIHRYYLATEQGRSISCDGFVSEYPDFEIELREFFENLNLVEAPVPEPKEIHSGDGYSRTGASRVTKPARGSVFRYFGEYELLEELGAGGMGIVFKARQKKLGRLVALKMIRSGELASSTDIQRFRTEARAAAKLTHPGIVPVHEVGIHNGQHFYTMDYVEGGSLSTLHRDEPVASKHAAALVRQLAEAIHYAHQQGIIHRDLKPTNVLLTLDGKPRITDFGLAKQLSGDVDTQRETLTETGQILGTAGYMAPEQAAGRTKLVGTSADIYAIGAVLYALITGRAPFVGESVAHTLLQVIHNDPVSPRVLNPSVPRDLETVCLKCLEKEPHKRFGTAQLLADELDRFGRGIPVVARPITSSERVWRWCRRNPVVASMLVAIAVSLMSGMILSAHFARQSQANARKNLLLAEQERGARNIADSHKDEAVKNLQNADRNLYLAHMNMAANAWAEGRVSSVVDLLNAHLPRAGEPDLRRFEWYYWQRKCHEDIFTLTGHAKSVNTVAYSRNGAWLISGSDDGLVKLWDAFSGQLVRDLTGHSDSVRCVSFSPDGNLIASSSADNRIILWEAATGRIVHILNGHSQSVEHVAFSPDGSLIASSGLDDQVILWNAISGKSAGKFWSLLDCRSVEFDPHGQRIVAADGASITVQDLQGNRQPLRLQSHSGSILDVAFSPHGTFVASGGRDQQVIIWDPNVGVRKHTLKGHSDTITSLAFNPNGSRLATSSLDQTARIWSPSGSVEIMKLRGHLDAINDVAFSPDGSRIATASKDRTVKVWNTSEQVPRAMGIVSSIKSIAINKNGESAVTSSMDGSIKLWNIERGTYVRVANLHSNGVQGVTYSPDGSLIATASLDGTICFVDSQTRKRRATIVADSGPLETVGFNADGSLLVSAGRNGIVTLWDTTTRTAVTSLPEQHTTVLDAAFSPDGSLIACGCGDSTIRVWDVGKEEALTLQGHQGEVASLSFCTTDSRLASASLDGTVKIWNLKSGQELLSWDVHSSGVYAVAWSPNVSRIATASHDGKVRLWDVDTGEEVLTLARESRGIYDLQFSPSGSQLISPSIDDTLSIWDGMELHSVAVEVPTPMVLTNQLLFKSTVGIECVVHSLDGQKLVAAGQDRVAHIWDMAEQREVQSLIGHERTISCADISPDGKVAVTASEDKTLRFWNTESGVELVRLPAVRSYSDIYYSVDGRLLFACSMDGKVRIWQLTNEYLPESKTAREFQNTTELIDMRDGSRRSTPMIPAGLAILPDNLSYIIGGWLGEILHSDTEDGRRLTTFDGHCHRICSLDLSATRRELLSASADHMLRIWELDTGQVKHLYRGHSDIVNEAQFFPDGLRFASASSDHTIRVWDTESEQQLAVGFNPGEVRGLSVSPDGRSLVTAGSDGSLRVWDISDFSKPADSPAKADMSSAINLSENLVGQTTPKLDSIEVVEPTAPPIELMQLESVLVAQVDKPIATVMHSVSGEQAFTAGYDQRAHLWDLHTATEVQLFEGHNDVIYNGALSHNGRTAVTAGEDRKLIVWDVTSGKQLWQFPTRGVFTSMCFSSDDRLLYAANWDGTVRVWQVSSETPEREFEYHTACFGCILLPDEQSIAIGTDSGRILICDTMSGYILKSFDGHSQPVRSVAVFDDGRRLLSASVDGTLQSWDVGTREVEKIFRGHSNKVQEVQVLSNETQFVSCGDDGTVRLWDVNSGKELARGTTPGGRAIRGISMAPDGKSFLSVGVDGTLRKWAVPK